jgi:3'(2'), 5'-bisphosphate nucleotidase
LSWGRVRYRGPGLRQCALIERDLANARCEQIHWTLNAPSTWTLPGGPPPTRHARTDDAGTAQPLTAISDSALAGQLAKEAGDLLLSLHGGVGRLAIDRWQLGRYADQRANALILERLERERPDDAVLSEESPDDRSRLAATRVWIIDPLDGTREFMLGRNDWAVHVALWEAGAGLTAAAVALPAFEQVFATDTVDPDAGSSAGDGSPSASRRDRPLILVSPTRPPWFAPFVARQVGADLATMGSAGAKAMVVLCGEADAYLHAAGQQEWDSAAPVAVLQAAGFHASRIDGSDLVYNQPDPYVPDFLMCRADLAAPLLAAISGATTARRVGH